LRLIHSPMLMHNLDTCWVFDACVNVVFQLPSSQRVLGNSVNFDINRCQLTGSSNMWTSFRPTMPTCVKYSLASSILSDQPLSCYRVCVSKVYNVLIALSSVGYFQIINTLYPILSLEFACVSNKTISFQSHS